MPKATEGIVPIVAATFTAAVARDEVFLWRRGLIASAYCRSPAYSRVAPELAQIETFLAEFAVYL